MGPNPDGCDRQMPESSRDVDADCIVAGGRSVCERFEADEPGAGRAEPTVGAMPSETGPKAAQSEGQPSTEAAQPRPPTEDATDSDPE